MSDMASKRSSHKQQAWLYAIAVLFCADFVFYGYMPSINGCSPCGTGAQRAWEIAAAQARNCPRSRSVCERRADRRHYNYPPSVIGAFLQRSPGP
jgi:hypothetical protein